VMESLQTVSLTVTVQTSQGTMTSTIARNAQTGGSYPKGHWKARQNRPIYEKHVPYFWLDSLYFHPSDQDSNRIEDILDNTTANSVNVVVAMNTCEVTNSISNAAHLSQWGNVHFESQFLSVLSLSNVSTASLASLAADTNVAMVFSDARRTVIASDTATYLHGLNYLAGGLLATVQNSWLPSERNGDLNMIGLFDTGRETTLAPGLWPYKSMDHRQYNALTQQAVTPLDNNGHGRLMRELITGEVDRTSCFPGAAPHAQIADIKVADSLGRATRTDILRGMEYVLDSGDIKIVVFPIRYPGATWGHDPLSEMANVMVSQDIFCVSAAGNDGNGRIQAPGAARDVLTVGNAEYDNNFMVSLNPNSSTGSDMLYGENVWKPEVAGLGTRVPLHVTIDPSLKRTPVSGTSFAAGIVAGVAAVIRGVRSDLRPLAIKRLIMTTAKDIAPMGWDNKTGFGLADAHRAVDTLFNGKMFDL
ncbi:MAG: S8 family serine peptidase, partial [Bacteroidota bacterium]